MKFIIIFLSLILLACNTSRKAAVIPIDQIKETTLRLSPSDSTMFELVWINDTGKMVQIGKNLMDYGNNIDVFDDVGNRVGMPYDASGGYLVIMKPEDRYELRDSAIGVIRHYLKTAKKDVKTFGYYTLVWKNRFNVDLSLRVLYDQGDIAHW